MGRYMNKKKKNRKDWREEKSQTDASVYLNCFFDGFKGVQYILFQIPGNLKNSYSLRTLIYCAKSKHVFDIFRLQCNTSGRNLQRYALFDHIFHIRNSKDFPRSAESIHCSLPTGSSVNKWVPRDHHLINKFGLANDYVIYRSRVFGWFRFFRKA